MNNRQHYLILFFSKKHLHESPWCNLMYVIGVAPTRPCIKNFFISTYSHSVCKYGQGLEDAICICNAVTYWVLNRRFIDQQSVGPGEAMYLIRALRY